jgi:hypothetical protein
MLAAAFWAIKINRTWDPRVGTEVNTRLGRDILHRIPSVEKRDVYARAGRVTAGNFIIIIVLAVERYWLNSGPIGKGRQA